MVLLKDELLKIRNEGSVAALLALVLDVSLDKIKNNNDAILNKQIDQLNQFIDNLIDVNEQNSVRDYKTNVKLGFLITHDIFDFEGSLNSYTTKDCFFVDNNSQEHYSLLCLSFDDFAFAEINPEFYKKYGRLNVIAMAISNFWINGTYDKNTLTSQKQEIFDSLNKLKEEVQSGDSSKFTSFDDLKEMIRGENYKEYQYNELEKSTIKILKEIEHISSKKEVAETNALL